MLSFGFKVVPAEGDGGVPVAVAGQIMVDIQKALTDIGCTLLRAELRAQGAIDPKLAAKFDLKVGGTSGDGIGSDPSEGNEPIMEEVMRVFGSTLVFLGKGLVNDWMVDHFPEPVSRREIARDIVALSDHLEGYVLEFGTPGNMHRFGKIDREKMKAVCDEDISKVGGSMVGVIYRDPVKANHWHISNGTDDFEIAFASTIDRGDIPEFAKAGPVIVTGLLSHDESGRRTGISEVNGCYTFPAVKFHRIIVPERDIILLNPAIGVPSYDAQSKAWHLECDLLGIDVSKPSWDECVIAFHDYFAFLWETYCESDDEFEGEEKEIRDYLKSLEPMV